MFQEKLLAEVGGLSLRYVGESVSYEETEQPGQGATPNPQHMVKAGPPGCTERTSSLHLSLGLKSGFSVNQLFRN